MFFHKNDNSDKGESHSKRGKVVPLLPLRDIIVFPHMVVPLFVGREKSINALEEAMSHEKEILLASQRKAKTNDPTPEDIFEVGTVGTIIQLLRLPDGTVKVLVEGKRRARIKRFIPNDDFFLCDVELVDDTGTGTVEVEALMRSVQSTFETYVKLNKRIPPEMLMTVQTIDDPSRLADTIVVHLTSIKLNDRQEILETTDPAKRLEALFALMNAEIEILQVEKKIRSRVKKRMEKSQKEYYLNEQMQAIQKELGERDEFKSEIQEIEEQLKTKKLSKEALTKIKKEAQEAQDDAADERRSHRRAQLHRLGARAALVRKVRRELRHRCSRGNPRRRPLRTQKAQRADPRVSRRPSTGEETQGACPVSGRSAGCG